MGKTKYWTCIIGDANKDDLKAGCDTPMRDAVNNAFTETVGYDADICWSGWSNERDRVDVINGVWSMDESDPIYKTIVCILKENNRL
jgi:hypothetical protein